MEADTFYGKSKGRGCAGRSPEIVLRGKIGLVEGVIY
jgi:hypothetical protein